jgi:hypothetical protein
MTCAIDARAAALVARTDRPREDYQHLIERLISRLPARPQAITRWLLRPSSRWIRIPAGVLLVCGGVLSILPLLGLWMLPLGLLLLAEDLPALRRVRNRLLDIAHQRRPHWFSTDQAAPSGHPAASSDTRS